MNQYAIRDAGGNRERYASIANSAAAHSRLCFISRQFCSIFYINKRLFRFSGAYGINVNTGRLARFKTPFDIVFFY